MYYGCWLDINQPNDPRFPIQPSPPDGGPFTGPLLSVADLIRGTHQCMVTEISFDLDPVIPAGVSTANCERLSQRNLAIDNSDNPGSLDTHRVQHTFAIHPTTSKPLPKQGPDELMIAWGNTPPGSLATVYLPGVRVSEVLDLAARNFNLQTLERVDDHTLSCRTGGVTYIPLPAGGELDLAGLITVDLPASVRRGQNFKIVLRQIVHTPAPQPTVQHPVAPQAKARGRRVSQARTERRATPSRHILGAFEFAVQVKTAKEILPGDERNLTAIERAAQKIPPENRWYPVFQRYIGQLRGRVAALGGGLPGPTPGTGPGPGPGSGPEPERISYEGKCPVCSMIVSAISRASPSKPNMANASFSAGKRPSRNWPNARGASGCALRCGSSLPPCTGPAGSSYAESLYPSTMENCPRVDWRVRTLGRRSWAGSGSRPRKSQVGPI
jgi:hypothetical protein